MASKKAGLGSGLDVLFGEAAVARDSATDFEYIAISKIEPNRNQPRSVFAERPLDELAESIKTHGVISPLILKKTGDTYQIIAGERRWRASRMAGLSEVPARVIDVTDREAAELSLVENLQREDLNPIEEALGYRSLAEDYDLTQDQIAAAMNKSRPVIANAMRLLSLPNEIIDYIKNGSLAAGSARALLTIPDDTVKLRAAREIIAGGLSTRKAEGLASRLLRETEEKPASQSGIRNGQGGYSEAEHTLTEILGRKVKIHANRKNSGRIELEYYDEDDFDILYNYLSRIDTGK